jgi:hypothetical protein
VNDLIHHANNVVIRLNQNNRRNRDSNQIRRHNMYMLNI